MCVAEMTEQKSETDEFAAFIEETGDVIIIKLKGDLKLSTLKVLKKIWDDIKHGEVKVIGFDLGKLNYMDSAAIGLIVQIFNGAKDKKIRTGFFNATEFVLKLWKTTKFFKHIAIVTKEEFEKKYMREVA